MLIKSPRGAKAFINSLISSGVKAPLINILQILLFTHIPF
jgi:hypothetical protein